MSGMLQQQYSVERPTYTRSSFDDSFRDQTEKEPKTCRRRLQRAGERVQDWTAKRFTRKKVVKSLQSVFPVTSWLPKYNVRQFLAADVITGVTVAIMMVPQSMGYAQIANLPPIHGLYTSFFALIIYFLMGTSRHISVAPAAVISWMTGTAVLTHAGGRYVVDTVVNATTMENVTEIGAHLVHLTADDIPAETRVAVATAVTLLVGFFELGMGALRLGFITLYLSDALTDAFVTGSALYILTSQLKYVFGVKIQSFTGPFKLIRTWYEILINLGSTSYPELIIAVSSILILIAVKVGINKRFKLRIPIPIDFFLVILLTCLSYFFHFKQNFHVKILEEIPMGIQSPKMPSADMLQTVVVDALVMAITAYTFTVSVAQHLAKKHNYSVDANQELLTLGTQSVCCSLFSGFTPAASMSRSLLQESLGGKTQVASAIASAFILSTLLYFGQYLETLPNAVLAAVIIVAMRSTFQNYKTPVALWKKSRPDFLVWIITYLGVILLEVHIGLVIGVGFSLLVVIVRTQFSRGVILGKVPDTDIYEDVKHFSQAVEFPGIKIFRYESDINYVNKDFFAKKLAAMTGIDPKLETIAREKAAKKARRASKKADKERKKNNDEDLEEVTVITKESTHIGKETDGKETSALENPAFDSSDLYLGNNNDNGKDIAVISVSNLDEVPPCSIQYIVLDCSMMVHIDLSGCEALAVICEEYQSIGVTICMANCQVSLVKSLEKMEFFDRVPRDNLYISIHDAILQCNEEGVFTSQEIEEEDKY